MSPAEQFTQAYIAALYWTDTGDSEQPPADAQLCPLSNANALNDCAAFWRAWGDLIDASGATPEQAGHDFWLTRNGHGTGFWDRDDTVYSPALRDMLDRASKQAGNVDPEFIH